MYASRIACAIVVAIACSTEISGNVLNALDANSGTITAPGTAASCDLDQFPDKAIVNAGPQFSIQYFRTYKVLTNSQTTPPSTYVLYQRGCPVPDVTADAKIAVPITKAYVRSSTFLKWIEIIGERSSVVGVNGLYTASPCLNQRINSKQTEDFSAAKYNSSGFFLNSAPPAAGSLLTTALDVTFTDPYSPKSGPNPVIVSSDAETSWQANAEWGKFVAAFYNREASINQLITTARSNWVCASKRSESNLLTTKKTAVWVTGYFAAYGGFSFAKCTPKSSKHCDLMVAAGLQPLDGATFTGKGDNLVQVAEWAKDVDFLFIADNACTYKGLTEPVTVAACDAFWKNLLDGLSGVKAVKNKAVYDIGRSQDPSGGSDFFVSVPVEPDVLLNDMVTVVQGSAVAGHTLTFLRNMLTEGAGNLRTCAEYPGTVGCRPSSSVLAGLCPAQGAPTMPLSASQGSIPCPPTAAAATTAPLAVWGVLAASLMALIQVLC